MPATAAAALRASDSWAAATSDGDADDDGATGLLVEREQVEAGDLALAHEAQARLAELAREGLPGGADEREHLLAVGVRFGDKTARGRCHQRLGRLVDTQHGCVLLELGGSAGLIG